jgi:hypothetical protein
VAIGLGALSFPLLLPGLLGAPLGVATWVLAGRDLVKMRAGHMDPRYEFSTRLARSLGFFAVFLTVGGACLVGIVTVAFFLLAQLG